MKKVIRRSKRNKIIALIIILLIMMSIGYSALQTTLSINGTAKINKAGWEIKFSNIQIKDGSVNAVEAPVIDDTDKSIEYEVLFKNLGEFYEFTVDLTNSSTMDAMISNLEGNSLSGDLVDMLDYEVTYNDGAPVEKYDKLYANSKETLKIRLAVKEGLTIGQLSDGVESFYLKFDFTQPDSNAKDRKKNEEVADNTPAWTLDKITAANYGNKIDYSVTVNGVELNTWSLFYESNGSAYMIYDGYAKNAIVDSSFTDAIKTGEYSVSAPKSYYDQSKASDFIYELLNAEKWTKLVSDDLKAKDSTATAYGSVAPNTWIWSWNAKGDLEGRTKYPKLYYTFGYNNYTVGTTNNPTTAGVDLSECEGYNDALYFPYHENVTHGSEVVSAYSMSGGTSFANHNIMCITKSGDFSFAYINNTGNALRPVIIFKANLLEAGSEVGTLKFKD